MRELVAPTTLWSPDILWKIASGETFLAGTPLVTLRQKRKGGGFFVEAFCLLAFIATLGRVRQGSIAGDQVLTAPEDGILLWKRTEYFFPHRLNRGTLVATYFPLKAWQEYEHLLQRQDERIAAARPEALPGLRAAAERLDREVSALRQQLSERRQESQRLLTGKLGALTHELIRRQREIDPDRLDAPTKKLLITLGRQLTEILKKQCPLPPNEFFALCDASLDPLLILEERLRRLDKEFTKRHACAPDSEKEQVRADWQERKEIIVGQLVGSGE